MRQAGSASEPQDVITAVRTFYESRKLVNPVWRPGRVLDIMPVGALQGKPVGIVAMGGSAHHYLDRKLGEASLSISLVLHLP